MSRLSIAVLLAAVIISGHASIASAAAAAGHMMVCKTTPFTITKVLDDTSNGCTTNTEPCSSSYTVTATSDCVYTLRSASSDANCANTVSQTCKCCFRLSFASFSWHHTGTAGLR